jgi:nucleoid-associated protein YgaU
MGNFEKLSVVVIVVIIVMILAVAVVEWTSSPSDSPTTDPATEKAEAPAVVAPDAGLEKAKGEKAKPKPAANKPSPLPFDLDLPKDAKDPWEQWRLGGDDAGKAKPDGKPDGKIADEKKDGAAPTPAPVTPPATTDIPESTYVVAEGDSLSLIAQKVWKKASLWPLIAEANPSVRPESMRKGETLKIPARKNVAAAPAGAASTGGGTKPTPGKEYTVQANDTWERISLAAYNTAARWPEIYVRNVDKVDMKSLRGGIVIMIPK